MELIIFIYFTNIVNRFILHGTNTGKMHTVHTILPPLMGGGDFRVSMNKTPCDTAYRLKTFHEKLSTPNNPETDVFNFKNAIMLDDFALSDSDCGFSSRGAFNTVCRVVPLGHCKNTAKSDYYIKRLSKPLSLESMLSDKTTDEESRLEMEIAISAANIGIAPKIYMCGLAANPETSTIYRYSIMESMDIDMGKMISDPLVSNETIITYLGDALFKLNKMADKMNICDVDIKSPNVVCRIDPKKAFIIDFDPQFLLFNTPENKRFVPFYGRIMQYLFVGFLLSFDCRKGDGRDPLRDLCMKLAEDLLDNIQPVLIDLVQSNHMFCRVIHHYYGQSLEDDGGMFIRYPVNVPHNKLKLPNYASPYNKHEYTSLNYLMGRNKLKNVKPKKRQNKKGKATKKKTQRKGKRAGAKTQKKSRRANTRQKNTKRRHQ